MKTFIVFGYNYKGKAVRAEIKARTKSSAANKFNKEYGSIATRIEEKYESKKKEN